MMNEFCFYLYAQNSLFIGENCNAFLVPCSRGLSKWGHRHHHHHHHHHHDDHDDHDDEQLECQLILPIEINKYQLIRPTQLECQLIFINVNLYLLFSIDIY